VEGLGDKSTSEDDKPDNGDDGADQGGGGDDFNDDDIDDEPENMNTDKAKENAPSPQNPRAPQSYKG
jgi:hypothetical protein